MTRPVALQPPRRADPSGRRAYTLIEILTATVLTLVMMTAVVSILASVSSSISSSRAGLEMMDRLRSTQRTLRRDLENLTVTMLPPRRPESAEGYFEYIEGPVGPVIRPEAFAVNSDTGQPDTTVADIDDIVMFTVRSPDVPFVGRVAGAAAEAQVAEIAWFVRGRTLYRRVLLVSPNVDLTIARDGFYSDYDLSVHYDGTKLVANTLSDLTKPENRFAHRTEHTSPSSPSSVTDLGFPYHPHIKVDWTASPQVATATNWIFLGLPTLRECSSNNWTAAATLPTISLDSTSTSSRDFWVNPHPWVDSSVSPAVPAVDATTGTLISPIDYSDGPRIGEDVILTNVIGFDVKAWDPHAPVFEVLVDDRDNADPTDDITAAVLPGDPGYPTAPAPPANYSIRSYGAYVDLGYYGASPNLSAFAGAGDRRSRMNPTDGPYVYDTWSFHYEHDGEDQDGDGVADEGTNGFDDDSAGDFGHGVVDDPDERETSPPYPHPLRGIQVKIRVFEPDSRQVREVTVVQDFLPK